MSTDHVFSAAVGTDVVAAHSGEVTLIIEDSAWGVTIEITTEDGYKLTYKCLGSVAEGITVGDTVTEGEVIGQIGDIAIFEFADAPHLHFEIVSPDGELLDPAICLSSYVS